MSDGKPAIPDFVQERLDIFNALQDRTPKVDPAPITITLLPLNTDAKATVEPVETIEGVAGETKPVQIMVSKYPKAGVVAALVNNTLWDLSRVLTESCTLSFVTFDDPRGKEVFWHSSAHVLGAAIELVLGCELAIGPATDRGFFYDYEAKEAKIDNATLGKIEKKCQEICKQKADYERKLLTREEAITVFPKNKYKQEILTTRIQPGELVTVYRTGTFIDLCRGPHLPTASGIQTWWLQDISASMWNGKPDHPLTRIRGVTFPTKDLMKEHKTFLEEAARRDHRKLGTDLGLFFFHPWSPGSAFFHPAGAHTYNRMIEMIRSEYRKRHFVEVITPNIFYQDLFLTSGHWAHYKDDMFHFPADATEQPAPAPTGDEANQQADPSKNLLAAGEVREFGMKPMNCPGHCLVFKSKARSYRELPIRMAEFGVLHRNEATGALTGLTRVRRFVQDDAHIFCRKDQIGQEIDNAIDFMKTVYTNFGMGTEFTLSTINMEKYMGDLDVWTEATEMLRNSIVKSGFSYVEAPGEAAFYGPKIDVQVKDCLGRKHQLATIQLDFQLPLKFDLSYVDSELKPHRPVMIHRAVLGSLERFFAIAIEHFAGKFPFWMSPRQIALIPQNMTKEPQMERCRKLYEELHLEGFMVNFDESSATMNKKIVNAFNAGTNVAIIIGDKEVENNTVTARWRESKPVTLPYAEFLEQIKDMQKNFK